ncbi:hypothetical protein [Robiginitalea sp. IMCC43444]
MGKAIRNNRDSKLNIIPQYKIMARKYNILSLFLLAISKYLKEIKKHKTE